MTTLAIALNIPQLMDVPGENLRVPQGDLGLGSSVSDPRGRQLDSPDLTD